MGLLQDYAAAAAGRAPGSVAVVGDDGATLTYGELTGQARRLATYLVARGCGPGQRVCILGPKSPRSIAAILGVLEAGAIFVPLDPASPCSRTAAMVRRCDTPWLLAHGPLGDLVPRLMAEAGVEHPILGWLDDEVPPGTEAAPDFTWPDLARAEERTLPRVAGDAPAYILFTSGSTGDPKGVVVTHANVRAFVDWGVRYFGIGPDDRISGHPPLHFDLSVFDVFGAAAAGAELHLVPSALNLVPHRMVAFMRERRLTQWFSVPSLLSYMAGADALSVSPDPLPELRRLLWCGEVFPTASLQYWMRRLPGVRFTNLYGPTETTIASSFHTLEAPPEDVSEAVPIGRACPGEELLVLDEDLRPCPTGEIGDLYVRGVGVSRGYWRDESRTRAVFVDDPEGRTGPLYRTGDLARMDGDGVCHFVGRADAQIKARGHRIELGEIEAALDAHAGLRESVVVGVPTSGFEGTRICCAYVADDAEDRSPAALNQLLREHLPAYMIPSRWQAVESLPRNANGKIDRPAVRRLFESAPARRPHAAARP